MDMIPVVDLRLLSQAELNTLALSSSTSSSSVDSRHCGDDVVVPKIDRSVFNESAGSRKQTYSRLRLAPPKSTPSTTTPSSGRRRGRPRSISIATTAITMTPTSSSAPDASAATVSSGDPGRKENEQIVQFLLQLFAKNGQAETLAAVSTPSCNPKPSPTPNPNPQPVAILNPECVLTAANAKPKSEQKKRGRKKKRVAEEEVGLSVEVKEEGRDDHILNGNGVAVDLVALGQTEGLFKDELAKRTAGLATEAEFLGFLNGLGGQWGSRRKRRKIVDAGSLGDGLPKGWKVILGLKRKEGSVWVHCRRYMSPSGKQFTTCKEISTYLLSLVGSQMLTSLTCVAQNEGTLISDKFNTGCDAGNIHLDDNKRDALSFSSGAPSYVTAESQKQGSIPKFENPAKSGLLNLLECRHCDLKFLDKATHVEHLSTFHLRNAKRCRLGKSISSGVIIKDGKFECQFCHKMFTERHRYNGHVGIHVRNYSQSLELLTSNVVEEGIEEPSSLVGLPVASEASATDAGKNEILANNTCSPEPICENNASASHHGEYNKDVGADCNPDSNALDSTVDASRTILLDGHANHYEGKGEKWGNNTESCNATNIEHSTCLGFGSYAKQLAPASTCKPSEIIIPESTLDSSSKSVVGQANSLDMEDERLQNVVEPSCAMDVGFNNCSSVGYDPKYGEPHMSSWTSINTLIDTNKMIGEDSRIVNNVSSITVNGDVNISSDSEIACDIKCNETENSDKATTIGTVGDQIIGCNMIDGNSIVTAESGGAALIDIACGPEQSRPGTTSSTIRAGDENNFSDKTHGKLGNNDKSSSSHFDACSSEISVRGKGFETESGIFMATQHDVNNIVDDKLRYSTQTSNAVNIVDDSFPICVENALSETSTEKCLSVSMVTDEAENNPGVRKVVPKSHLDNVSCNWQDSTENSLFSYREIDEIDKSLCEQQLYLESNLNSLPSTMQSYNVQTSADGILADNIEKDDLVEASDYGKQDCTTVPSGGGQACGIEVQMGDKHPSSSEEPVACEIREPCNKLGIDLGFGLSGTNKDSMMDSGVVGGSTIDNGLLNPSSLWLQPSNRLSAADMISDQGMNKFYGTQQKQEYASGFEDLRLDGFGPSNPIMLANQTPGLRPEDTMDLAYNEGLGNVFAPPIQLEWEMTAPDMVSRHHHHQVTTVCMWCAVEFSHESVTLQPQSDSIGFICPTCKSKISGQLKF